MLKNKPLIISLISILSVGLLVILGVSYFKSSQPSKETSTKLKITASFYPLAEFSQQVGQNLVEVKNLTPAGAEPHDFEPTTQDIQSIYASKLFVYNGVGLEAWAAKVQPEADKQGVKTLEMSKLFQVLKPLEVQGITEDSGESETQDPHFWINPVMAKKQVQDISDNLSSIDPKNQNIYQANAQKYIDKLDKLDQDFKQRLANCQKHEVVTSHNFLQYLGKEYAFTSIPINGLSPDSEPSSKQLAAISDLVKTKQIKYIFTETLASPKLSETISREAGAQTLVLNPLEGLTPDELAQGKDYISVQRENLQNLSLALECKV